MKITSLFLVFAAGSLVGWGAHRAHPEAGTSCPTEITVKHPDPDLDGASMVTRVSLCRIGDEDLAPLPSHATVSEYWELKINGVKYCGVGREVRTVWSDARDARVAERSR